MTPTRWLERRTNADGTLSLILHRTKGEPVRMYADLPMTIRVVAKDRESILRQRDPLLNLPVDEGEWYTAGFKTQCVGCMQLFGAWDKRDHVPESLRPSEDTIRCDAVALLRRDGFEVNDDGVRCPACRSGGVLPPGDILLREGDAPVPRGGWLTWPADA